MERPRTSENSAKIGHVEELSPHDGNRTLEGRSGASTNQWESHNPKHSSLVDKSKRELLQYDVTSCESSISLQSKLRHSSFRDELGHNLDKTCTIVKTERTHVPTSVTA